VTLQMLSHLLLLCLGVLLGISWTLQAIQYKFHRQAEERRLLNEEWLAIRAARRQRLDGRRRLTTPVIELAWYSEQTVLFEDPSDDD
jgi:hypothetical protein